jgi:hypothetical protein
MTTTVPVDGGTLRWVLASDARTKRLLWLLYPTCITTTVVSTSAAIWLGHAPVLSPGIAGTVAAAAGITVPAALRLRRGKNKTIGEKQV